MVIYLLKIKIASQNTLVVVNSAGQSLSVLMYKIECLYVCLFVTAKLDSLTAQPTGDTHFESS